MSATNKTTNYELPLFVDSDQPTWLGDFNGAMNKIDADMTQVGADAKTALNSADNALSLAQTNEQDIAVVDSQLAGTRESGMKTLIEQETARAKTVENAINTSKNNNTGYRVVYVAPTGDDTNPGTETKPLKTIDAAFALIPQGSTILEISLAEGEYTSSISFFSNVVLHLSAKTSAHITFSRLVKMYNCYIDLNSNEKLTVSFNGGLHVDKSAFYVLNTALNIKERYDFSFSSLLFAGTCSVTSNVSCNMTNTTMTTNETSAYTHELTADAEQLIYAVNCRIAIHGTTTFNAPAGYTKRYIRAERGFICLLGTITFNVTAMSTMLVLRSVFATIADTTFAAITQAKINSNYSYIKHTNASVFE